MSLFKTLVDALKKSRTDDARVEALEHARADGVLGPTDAQPGGQSSWAESTVAPPGGTVPRQPLPPTGPVEGGPVQTDPHPSAPFDPGGVNFPPPQQSSPADYKLEGLKIEGLKVEGLKVEDIKFEGQKVGEIKIESFRPEGLKVEDVKIEGLKVEDIKLEGGQLQGFEPGTQDVERATGSPTLMSHTATGQHFKEAVITARHDAATGQAGDPGTASSADPQEGGQVTPEGAGADTGKVHTSDIHFTHQVDKSSPVLMRETGDSGPHAGPVYSADPQEGGQVAPDAGGSDTAKAHPSDFSFTHQVDKASPVLMRESADPGPHPGTVYSADPQEGGQIAHLEAASKFEGVDGESIPQKHGGEIAFAEHAGSAAPHDRFAKFGDIKGESMDDRHKDWIEAVSHDDGPGDADAEHHFDVKIEEVFKPGATPPGIPLPYPDTSAGDGDEGALGELARKAGKGQQEFLVVKMNEVQVSGVQQAPAPDGASHPGVGEAHDFASLDVDDSAGDSDFGDGDDNFESSTLLPLEPDTDAHEMLPGLAGDISDSLDVDVDFDVDGDPDADTDESDL